MMACSVLISLIDSGVVAESFTCKAFIVLPEGVANLELMIPGLVDPLNINVDVYFVDPIYGVDHEDVCIVSF